MSLVTTAAGGKITGLLALTFETDVSLPVGTPVEVDGDYHVTTATGSALVVGTVDVANVARVGAVYPSYVTPGVVTVEARGFSVRKYTLGGTVAAGDGVKWNGSAVVTGGSPDDNGYLGIALTGGNEGDEADVLVN